MLQIYVGFIYFRHSLSVDTVRLETERSDAPEGLLDHGC